MSRRIIAHTTATQAQQNAGIREGKLLLTTVKGREMALCVQNNRLLEVRLPDQTANRTGAVYLGKVKKLQKNINACFVEITEKELVYLPLEKCTQPFLTNRTFDGRILEGDELIIQLERDAQKTKLAAATARITLTGRYAVLHTGSVKAGISSKLKARQREELTQCLIGNGLMTEDFQWVKQPERGSLSAIIRTEAAEISEEVLLEELAFLQDKLLTLLHRASFSTCFTALTEPASRWESCINSFSACDYTEAVTDEPALYQELSTFFHQLSMPFRFYNDPNYSLSRLYSLETKVEEALSRRIWLKSGAYLIVDATEALTVFDVNSGKYEVQRVSDEAFYRINQEAANEIALQIRLRNLSGIILIDFINMNSAEKEASLLAHMRQAVAADPVQTAVIDITPLGLMELTRKKVSRSLYEQIRRPSEPETIKQ